MFCLVYKKTDNIVLLINHLISPGPLYPPPTSNILHAQALDVFEWFELVCVTVNTNVNCDQI